MTKPMSLTGFARRVEYIKAHRKDKKHSESAAVARKLSRQLREVLCDEQDNLNRWLDRRPCIVRSPWEEGREQEVMIRNDTEALYYFLLYCQKVNVRERISEEFADYCSMPTAMYLLDMQEEPGSFIHKSVIKAIAQAEKELQTV